jgi:hypothetical protein
MAKPLSEQLAELSVHAKNAEDAVAAAQKEAHDKIVARRDQAHAAATAAIEKVDRYIKSAGDSATKNWNALKAKVTADIDAFKAGVAQRKRELDVKLAEKQAEGLEWEAGCAIDYAIGSIEQAKYAVLDAIVGRVEAEEAKRR